MEKDSEKTRLLKSLDQIKEHVLMRDQIARLKTSYFTLMTKILTKYIKIKTRTFFV